MMWDKVKLKDIATQVRGVSYKPEDVSDDLKDGYTTLYRANNITETGLLEKDFVFVKSKCISEKQKLLKGDILIAASSGSINIVGKAVYIHKNLDAAFGAFCKVVRFDPEKVEPRYLSYYFQSATYRRIISNLAAGANINNIRNEDIDNLYIPVPPKEVQKQIADTLDKADALRRKDALLLKKYDELAKAIFYDMFGDPIENEKEWEVKKLSKVCGVGSSVRVFVEDLVENGIPFYRGKEIGELSEGEISKPTLFITEEHYRKLKLQGGVPKIGDLLLPSICPDGRILIVTTNQPFYFKDGRVLWIKVDKECIESLYLRYLLRLVFASKYSSIASGSTFAELKIFSLKDIDICIPPHKLQQKFTLKVEKLLLQKKMTVEIISKSETLYNGLLNKYFA